MTRVLAVTEVVFVCCLCHGTYRALQQSPLGDFERAVQRSYLPGTVMLGGGAVAILLHGRGCRPFGVTRRHWPYSLMVGLACALLFVLLGGSVVLLGLNRLDAAGTAARSCGWLVGALVILALLSRHSVAVLSAFQGRWTGWCCASLLLLLLAMTIVLGLRSRQPLLTTVCAVTWLFALTGFGEELFFRGYCQSRLNGAFGRPYRLLGMDFGAGLLIASVLFGAFHVLNTVDYFQGRFQFAWASGVVSAFSGLCYGSLRERTGSIVAGGVAHGLAGAMTEIPRVLQG
jgi:membrane protease YdiL (CAAX protease family)